MKYLQWKDRTSYWSKRVLAEIKDSTKHRKVTLVLLCLLAHAILVTITHHHKLKLVWASGTSTTLESSTAPMQGGLADPQGDSGCLSCSLQRSFVSDVRPFRIAVMLPEPERWQLVPLVAATTEPYLSTCNRAPPMSVSVEVAS
jgi:hypothetical protein